jgi:shikimate dehydrogenase
MNDDAPKLAGVMGWPIAHSRSPALHGHWLARHGLRGFYVPLAVAPDRFEQAFLALGALGFRGANVTAPHKEAALRLADEASPFARRVGAANTLILRDGGVFADNTDGFGFIENLREGAPCWRPEAGPALVLGAGGAARGVAAALLDAGAPEVRLANRTRSRAEALAGHLGAGVTVVDWAEAAAAADGAALIVNTASPGDEPCRLFDFSAAAPGAVATDIVYVPLITPFLAAAAARGLRTVDGLGMLLHQARPGFQAWFGVRPTVDAELRAAVLR